MQQDIIIGNNIINKSIIKFIPWDNKNIRKTWEVCGARRCHEVYNNYLYKCSIIAGLESVLSETNQTNEKEWQKYLNYSPIHYTDF